MTDTLLNDGRDPELAAFGRRLFRRAGQLLAAAALLFLAGSSVLFVDEAESVIVERLGEIVAVYDRPEDRGLHFKLPWPVDAVRRFDRRVQLLDPPGREIFTGDKKNVTLDAYVCWKIAEPGDGERAENRPVVRFFRSLGSAGAAEAQLATRVQSTLGTHIGQVELSRLLTAADSESGPQSGTGLLQQISEAVREELALGGGERESLRDRLGIEVIDVRIKRINLPSGNQQAVFERMRSERRKIADRYRSAGMAENRVIRSQADRQSAEILARARADAERIRGEAEAQAIEILNAAHAQDPEFHGILQTLDTYRRILNPKTTLVLSASSNLLKLLTEGVPELDAPPPPADERESPAVSGM